MMHDGLFYRWGNDFDGDVATLRSPPLMDFYSCMMSGTRKHVWHQRAPCMVDANMAYIERSNLVRASL